MIDRITETKAILDRLDELVEWNDPLAQAVRADTMRLLRLLNLIDAEGKPTPPTVTEHPPVAGNIHLVTFTHEYIKDAVRERVERHGMTVVTGPEINADGGRAWVEGPIPPAKITPGYLGDIAGPGCDPSTV